MRAQSQRVEEDLEVNMTPMLDIVFIMLIFFIVTAVFVKESGVDVLRPEAKTANNIKRVSTLIGVTKDSKIWINKREITLEEVRVVVAKLKQENPKGNVVIQADVNSHSGIVVAIIEQLNQIGVAGVSIATRQGGGV
jgi:biopolymer transport protein ExbD